MHLMEKSFINPSNLLQKSYQIKIYHDNEKYVINDSELTSYINCYVLSEWIGKKRVFRSLRELNNRCDVLVL